MSEKMNAGYRDLLAQREALDEQIEALRRVERGDVINWIFEQMALFQIKPEDLVFTARSEKGLRSGRRQVS